MSLPLSSDQSVSPMISPSSQAIIMEAVTALSSCLGDSVKWALVGGAAMICLGSGRNTEDVDVVIHPPSKVREAKNLLKSDDRFTIEPRTRHTTFKPVAGTQIVQIDFLSFPGTFKSCFNEETTVLRAAGGCCVLAPPSLLDSKCKSVRQRSNQRKVYQDTRDIVFLLNHLHITGQKTSRVEVPAATDEFQDWFGKAECGTSHSLFRQVGL